MSDNTAKVMSEETLAVVLPAIKALHACFGIGLPAWDNCKADDHRTVLSRAYNAIEATELVRLAATINAASVKVNAVIDAKRAEMLAATSELAKLPASVRAMLGVKLPDHILVSLSEVQGCFPQNTSETDMVKALHSLGFQLAKGAKGDRGVRLSIPLTPKAA